VVPYLDLLIKNGLAERVEGEIVRYRITPRGEEALGHLQELEKLMPEIKEMAEQERALSQF
jgi:predicted transcriptional regulator